MFAWFLLAVTHYQTGNARQCDHVMPSWIVPTPHIRSFVLSFVLGAHASQNPI
jgi:hypothetical protein